MDSDPHVLQRSILWTIAPVNPLSDPYTFGHSPSLIRMPDGKLLAVWWAQYLRGGCVLGCYSTDDGGHWSEAQPLDDVPDVWHADPALLRDGERVWLFYNLWFGHHAIPSLGLKITPLDNSPLSRDCYYRYSDDSGQTWTQSRLLDRHSCLRAKGIRLKNGELLLPAWEGRVSRVLKSTDRGASWRRCGHIQTAETAEPCVLELTDGRILMFLRAEDGHIWRSVSEDAGDNWSAAESTQLVQSNHPAELFRLADGTIALGYDASLDRGRRARTALGLRFSKDEGDTWSEPLIVEAQPEPQPPRFSIGYPSIAEDQNGNILVSYYHKWQQPGEELTTQIKVARLARPTAHA